MDVMEFVMARLDEAASRAQRSGPAQVAWLTFRDGEGRISYTSVASSHGGADPWIAAGTELPVPATVRVVYDPARARREIAAKRTILTMHGPIHDSKWLTYPEAAKFCGFCGPGDNWQAAQEPEGWGFALWPCEHVRLLASVDCDHPDFDEAWKVVL